MDDQHQRLAKLLTTPKLLRWTYVLGVLLVVPCSLMLPRARDVGLIFLTASASLDGLVLYGRVARDEGATALMKIVPLSFLVALSAVFARTSACGVLARALGTDPNVAPRAQDLLTVIYTPLYAGELIGTVFIVVAIVCSVADVVHAFFQRMRTDLRLLYAAFRTAGENIRRAVSQPAMPPLSEPEGGWPRPTEHRFLGGLLLLRIWLVPLTLFGASAYALVGLTSHHNAVKLLVLTMDLRAGTDCLHLETAHIASIPNVDDAVLVMRCARGDCSSTALWNSTLPNAPSSVSVTRAQCQRTPEQSTESDTQPKTSASPQAFDAGT